MTIYAPFSISKYLWQLKKPCLLHTVKLAVYTVKLSVCLAVPEMKLVSTLWKHFH